jgi:hypothetical protein
MESSLNDFQGHVQKTMEETLEVYVKEMDTQKALFNLNLEKAIPDLVKEKLEVMKP